MDRRLAAILAVDMVGYSRLLEPIEAGILACLRILLRSCIDPEVVADDDFDAPVRGTCRDIHKKLNREFAIHDTEHGRGMAGF